MPRLLIVLLGSLLFGCAGPTGMQLVANGQLELDNAPSCCTTLAEALRQKLPAKKTNLVFDKSRQAFDFGGNKAFFILFELPAFTQTYSLVVRSVSSGQLGDSALFIPRVAIYDAEFQPTRFFEEKTLRSRGNSLERTIFINPQNAAEKYLAIFGSDLSSTIERTYSMVTAQPIFAGPVMFYVYSGRDAKSILRSSPTGMVEFEVQDLETPATQH